MGLYDTPLDMLPVAPIEWTERLSQTLLKTENRCPHGAYLYVDKMGKVRSHEMDRGTLVHSAAEMVMLERIVHGDGEGPERAGQGARYAPDMNVPFEEMDEALSMQTTALVQELRLEMEAQRKVHISAEEADVARICTYHLARCLDVPADTVLGVERKWVFDLPTSGWEVSVKADLIHTPDVGLLVVDDYKSSLHMPPHSEWSTFQVKTALVALLYGYPVEVTPCPNQGYGGLPCEARGCEVCGGRGKIESRGVAIGSGWSKFGGRELYPRLRPRTDGKLQHNEESFTRLELDEFLGDLDAAGHRITQGLKDWIWPARKGSWCTECAAREECPLLNDGLVLEGAVQDREHASELWKFALAYKDLAGDLESAVKAWAKKTSQSVVVGDLMWAWNTTETRSVKKAGRSTDWEGLEIAIQQTVDTGVPFDLKAWVKKNSRTEFKKTKVADARPLIGEVIDDAGTTGSDGGAGNVAERWRDGAGDGAGHHAAAAADELAGGRAAGAGLSAAERFGDEPPFD